MIRDWDGLFKTYELNADKHGSDGFSRIQNRKALISFSYPRRSVISASSVFYYFLSLWVRAIIHLDHLFHRDLCVDLRCR